MVPGRAGALPFFVLMEISLLSLNTWKCDGPYRVRLHLLLQEIRRLQPGVIALQEVFQTEDGTYDTAHYLARELGMACSVLPARRKMRLLEGRSWDSRSGLAVLSRYPVLHSEGLALSQDPRDGERWVQHVSVLPAPGRPFEVFNLHLTHLKEADALRMQQVEEVLGWAAYREAAGPRLICGDFNAFPSDALHKRLSQVGESLFPLAAYPLTHPGADTALDYVYLEKGHIRVTEARIVMDRPDPERGCLPSDHYGLFARLIIP